MSLLFFSIWLTSLLGEADAVVYGRLFLANPDLPERYKQKGSKLNDVQWQFLYAGGNQGYIDYPTLAELNAKQ
jgi:N-ethylmaleimide reductase